MIASYCRDAIGDTDTIIKKEGALVFESPEKALEHIHKYDMHRYVVVVNAQGKWERDTLPYRGEEDKVPFRTLNKTMQFAVWVPPEVEIENPLYS